MITSEAVMRSGTAAESTPKQPSVVGHGRQPQGQVAHVGLYIGEPRWIFLHGVPRSLFHEARTAHFDIPVVVGKVVKARLGDGAAEPLAVPVTPSLEGDGEIE